MKNTLFDWSLALTTYSYFPLLIGSVLVIVACLIAGPRSWSRRLCVIGLWITGLFLLSAVALFTNFFHIVGFHGEWSGIAAIPILACIPVVFEFVGLLAVARWRCRRSRLDDA